MVFMATRCDGSRETISAAAYGGDNLDAVTRVESRFGVPPLGNDLAVALDRDALVLQRELAHEVGDGQTFVTAVGGAVEDDREHGGNSGVNG
jgi:hypothetical protein